MKRTDVLSSVCVCVGGGGTLFILIRLRQVAAHAKPLTAWDSNDTGREQRAWVIQRFLCVCVIAADACSCVECACFCFFVHSEL